MESSCCENEIRERRLFSSNNESCIGEWQTSYECYNTGQGELHLYRGQNIGIVDLRSAGYFCITGDGIQKCLHERYIFLNEKESQEYLSHVYN